MIGILTKTHTFLRCVFGSSRYIVIASVAKQSSCKPLNCFVAYALCNDGLGSRLYSIIVLFLNNLTLSTFRHPILQARKGKNNYEKHYKQKLL